MTELYLILHRVRGLPAFDIAQKLCQSNGLDPCQPNCGLWQGDKCLGEGEWIIPTSGHVAYPYINWPLKHLIHDRTAGDFFGTCADEGVPSDLPDHYATHSVTIVWYDKSKLTLESLGLTKAKPPERLKRP